MKFNTSTGHELEQRQPPKWLIKGVLPAKGLVTFIGKQESFKSSLVLDIALSTAYGIPWHGHPVAPGRVLYVAAEADYTVAERYRAWRHVRGREDVAPCDFVTQWINLRDENDVERLRETVEAMSEMPVVLVVDTLSQTFGGGEENSSADMMQYITNVAKILEVTGGAALIIHHMGLQGIHSRGHSSLPCAVDAEIFAYRHDPMATRVTLKCNKMRAAKKFGNLKFEGNEVHIGIGSTDEPPLVFELIGGGPEPDVGAALIYDARYNDALIFATLVHEMGNPLATEVAAVQGQDRDIVNRYAKTTVKETYGFIEIARERIGRSNYNRFLSLLDERELARGRTLIQQSERGRAWLERFQSGANEQELPKAA